MTRLIDADALRKRLLEPEKVKWSFREFVQDLDERVKARRERKR